MPRRRGPKLALLLIALTGVMYLLVSLFLPSPRRLIFGVDKSSGKIRRAGTGIAFLPPHRFYRLSFEMRDGSAQRDDTVRIMSREGVPVRIFYRLRFGIEQDRLPDASRLVKEGWSAWIRARVGEAVSAVTREVPVEDFSSPTSDFAKRRDLLRQTVANHLGRSGLEVTAFEIQRIEVDREALLQYKRVELRRNARGAIGKVAVFSIDGADWELISELIVDGRLPNIQALMNGGVSAAVQTIQPTISSLLWTTAATGVSPDRHGVVDFFDARNRQQPVSSTSRRVPAVWEIADAFDRPSAVVGWWTSWPPPQQSESAFFDTPVALTANAVHPPEIQQAVIRGLVPLETVGFQQVNRFLNITNAEFQAAIASNDPNDPIRTFRSVLSKTWSDHRAGAELYRAKKPALFMMSYGGTDVVNHLFGPYHPPLRPGVSSEDYRRYWPTVANYYSEVDRMIGEWMQILPDDTTVILMSAHGMRWGKARPLAPPSGSSALDAHRAPGFMVAYGNRIVPSRARRSFSIFDLAPTVLTILGLPPSHEMSGQFASWAFDNVSPIEGVGIASYRDLLIDRHVPSPVALDPAAYRTHLLQIGHIVDPGRVSMPLLAEQQQQDALTPQQWGLYAFLNNQGVQRQQQKNSKEAVESLEQAIAMNPGRPIPYLNLSIVLFDLQRYTDSEKVFFEALVRGLPNAEQYIVDYAELYRSRDMVTRAIGILARGKELFPESYLIASNLGSALASVSRYTDALPELERALGLRPSSTVALNNLALYHMKREDLGRALDYWNRSLAIDPRQPKVREAVNAAQSRI